MKHDVAKQAANEMALTDIDKLYYDQRISPAVVTVGGEEGNIDVLTRSGVWPGDFCAPRVFVVDNVLGLSVGTLERIGRLHAFLVQKCPVAGQSTSLGTTEYVDDFLCVICLELECASRKDGGQQQPPSSTAATLP